MWVRRMKKNKNQNKLVVSKDGRLEENRWRLLKDTNFQLLNEYGLGL